MIRRVLITGSRTWTDIETITDALGDVYDVTLPQVLVSGACPIGADVMCEEVWAEFGGQVERHLADWGKYGKRAGFLRNAHMVELGADICLAFIHAGSKGASMTADLAEKAGIPTTRYLA